MLEKARRLKRSVNLQQYALQRASFIMPEHVVTIITPW
jgi:hypothetical protein